MEHHSPCAFRTLCIETFCTRVTSSFLCTNILCIHLGSLDTKILYLEPFQKFFSYPSVSLSSSIGFHLQPVAKVKIFTKLLMYVLSHGCLLSSYKALFNLHTWVYLSCVLTSNGCKCLFVVYAFFPWEDSCYESCLVSHDVSIYCMLDLVDPYGRHYALPFRSWYCILDIIILELVFSFPFFLATSS